MNLRNIEYLVQEAFVGIWRNGIMALASISTVALSMAVLGTALLMALGANRFIQTQLGNFEIMAFTRDGATLADAKRLEKDIKALPLATNVELLSREKEWSDLKKKLNADMSLGGVIDNPLPYAVSVKCKSPERTHELKAQIKNLTGSPITECGDDSYGIVRTVARLIKFISLGAVILLCFATVFLVGNAIRLTLYARRQEIRIMQLVGATNWFIRAPLILEGVVLGAIGAIVAGAIISGGSGYVSTLVRDQFPMMLRDMSSGLDSGQFIIMLVISGAIIGAFGSLISIRRFLHI